MTIFVLFKDKYEGTERRGTSRLFARVLRRSFNNRLYRYFVVITILRIPGGLSNCLFFGSCVLCTS